MAGEVFMTATLLAIFIFQGGGKLHPYASISLRRGEVYLRPIFLTSPLLKREGVQISSPEGEGQGVVYLEFVEKDFLYHSLFPVAEATRGESHS